MRPSTSFPTANGNININGCILKTDNRLNMFHSGSHSANEGQLCSAALSGGVDRRTRAKSEKRELVDDWFLRSFTRNGNENSYMAPLDGKNDQKPPLKPARIIPKQKQPQTFESITEESEYCSSSTNNVNPIRSYSGSKTAPIPAQSVNNEWDFLKSLNEFLRSEHLLDEDINNLEPQNQNPPKNIAPNRVQLSPRPPRPKLSAKIVVRKRDYTKPKPIKVAHCQQSALRSEKLTSRNEKTQQYPRKSTPPPQLDSYPPPVYENLPLGFYKSTSQMSAPLSNSLDSIYDRMRFDPGYNYGNSSPLRNYRGGSGENCSQFHGYPVPDPYFMHSGLGNPLRYRDFVGRNSSSREFYPLFSNNRSGSAENIREFRRPENREQFDSRRDGMNRDFSPFSKRASNLNQV